MSLVAHTNPRRLLNFGSSKTHKMFATAVAISALLFVLPALGSPAKTSHTQTQAQLNEEACAAYKKADAEMNRAYGLIMRNYRGDRGFISAMRKAQLAWIRYRDAHLESIFPGDPAQYGSVNPMCRCTSLEEMTKARTQILKQWVEGIEEGDVCAGSVKIK